MLDTVILLIPWGNYKIINNNKFNPPTDGLDNFRFVTGTEYINNATKTEKERYYYPRMTLFTKPFYGQTRVLKVEFSVPKLLTGENVNEYEEYEYYQALYNLRLRMYERGVAVNEECLMNASVVAFHVGKNIPLTDGYTTTLAIQELAKIDISKQIDLNKADFRNEGHAYQFYTNSYALVMYDKINDLNKTKGRATDKDKTDQQLSLFKNIKDSKYNIQLLRLELRLSKKSYMNTTLQQLGYKTNPILQDILSHKMSQYILNQYWNKFFNDNNKFVLDMDNNPHSILKRTLHHNPNMSIRQAIKAVGFNLLARDNGGMRKLRTLIESYRPNSDWNDIKKDVYTYKSPPFPINSMGFTKDIERELSTFKPYKLNLPCKEK